MSVIFTDSNCELSWKTIEELGVELIKMPYTLENEEYYYDDGKDQSFKCIYDKMRKGAVAITSALSPQNYVDYFEPFFKKGEDILYIAFSDKLSGTFNYLGMALEELKEKHPERKFTRFNTASISYGGGIQVIEAVKLQKQGLSDEEIVAKLEEFKNKVRIYFYVDSLTYLRRGGRISSASAVFGGMLNIKPILTCKDGSLLKLTTVKGQKKAIAKIVELFMSDVDLSYDGSFYIIDADAKDSARELNAELEKACGGKAKFETNDIGPVITAHAGPGTLGLIYVAK